jgi:hypothetical protein
MHYTSVPNIQKVLDPLFLDDLREQLEAAGTNKRKLFNLRQRLSRIRVFDPACGSGNFLVIAYIRMREIEDEIMRRRGEALERSAISLTQFYGIEIKSFAAEIARLSLLIAEFQCDVRFIGQMEARALVLPLHATGTVLTGNALLIDWEEVCPPVTASAEVQDLGGPTGRSNLERAGEEWETYICGNPPYLGSRNQSEQQKSDLYKVAEQAGLKNPKVLDYVCGWLLKGSVYQDRTKADFAFVTTNSICQGQQVPVLWSNILRNDRKIFFAHTTFPWKNLAAHNAAVMCIVVGVTNRAKNRFHIYERNDRREVSEINRYLLPASDIEVTSRSRPICNFMPEMDYGNKAADNGHLIISPEAVDDVIPPGSKDRDLIRTLIGSSELLQGKTRYCLWIDDADRERAMSIPAVAARVRDVEEYRRTTKDKSANSLADRPHQFREMKTSTKHTVIVPGLSSERREYVPAALLPASTIVSLTAFSIFDADIWNIAILCSKLHYVWNFTFGGKMKSDVRYSNSLCWNTFPVPKLTEADKASLTRCAEDILLAREAHFPATIAELYDPEKMPDDLRAAHDGNDETLERVYIGRRFRNDTERLEKLFDMYTKMTAKKEKAS